MVFEEDECDEDSTVQSGKYSNNSKFDDSFSLSKRCMTSPSFRFIINFLYVSFELVSGLNGSYDCAIHS